MDDPCNFYTVDNFLIFCKNKSTFFWYSEYDFWFGGIHKLHWCFSMDIFCQCPFIGLFEFFIYTVSYLGQSQTAKKCVFCVFRLFLSLCQTASRPYKLSHINALRINQFYLPKDQSMKISWKNIENLHYGWFLQNIQDCTVVA